LQTSRTELSHAEEQQFVPAVLDVAPSSPSVRRQRTTPRRQIEPGKIDIEIDGEMVRVGRGAEVKTGTSVLRASKVGACGLTDAIRVMVATKPVDFRKARRDWRLECARRWRRIHSRGRRMFLG
jgi:hypothetical protein